MNIASNFFKTIGSFYLENIYKGVKLVEVHIIDQFLDNTQNKAYAEYDSLKPIVREERRTLDEEDQKTLKEILGDNPEF